MLVQWTALQPSSRARHLRQLGVGIAAASSVALIAASVLTRPFNIGVAILAALAAVAVALGLRKPVAWAVDVSVAADGEIRLRRSAASDADPMPVRVVFAAPWLISLRSGTMLVAIWPDSLSPSVYRRLWVHLHWGRAVPSGDQEQSKAGGGGIR